MQQVAKYFREIFVELAPGGHGDLVMVKRRREEEGADEEGSDDEGDDGAGGARQQAGGMEIMTQYTGVKAKVSRGWVRGLCCWVASSCSELIHDVTLKVVFKVAVPSSTQA